MLCRPCLAGQAAHLCTRNDGVGTLRRGTAISILDTGVGIKPEDARRLFQPFFSTKSTKGTGLGLWISKGIVQKYDGSLTCRSLRTKRMAALPVSASFSPSAARISRRRDLPCGARIRDAQPSPCLASSIDTCPRGMARKSASLSV